ncbi:MAG: flotillin-like FloA family protein [Planctomycetes bacterium]|nr:flotillin-like FloA family protein [Planctomycetota bacterium]
MFYTIVALMAVIVLIFFAYAAPLFGLWVQAFSAQAQISMARLVGMKLRRVNLRDIVIARIQSVRAGLQVSIDDLEKHNLLGGDPVKVVNALLAARRANIDLPWETAAAFDLDGGDILEAVQTMAREDEQTNETDPL